jgi:ribonuclease E
VIDFIDMEESRNRRDVENRLRDALRQDRARVQFGTISKFGLMEMSRQRLRPALSEGASIPCPRCGGSGHIRDTESSALQILRIIQEESMKDSTASVLCQVPVDVASFLLNEKRAEIAKIELKQRINVLMVPNKTLETPNYKLERLKHDDPRLDNIEASYKLADEMEDPTTVTRRSQERSNKQEPIIKGVLPDQPAPIAPPAPVKPEVSAPLAPQVAAPVPATGGFFGWIKSLFGTPPASEPAAKLEPDKKEAKREDRAPRGGRNEGRGGRGQRDGGSEQRPDGQGRGGRNEGRGGRGQRAGQGPRADAQRGDGQRTERATTETVNAPLNPEGQNALGTEARTDRGPRTGERSGRGRNRGERGDRGPRAESAGNADTPSMQPAAATQEAQALPVDTEVPESNGQVSSGQQGSGNEGERNDTGENSERRSRRPRNRGGRDRQERNGNDGTSGATEALDGQLPSIPADAQPELPEQSVQRDAMAAPAAAPAEEPTPPPATSQQVQVALPVVQAYLLPVADLGNVAQTAGLVWVNSDTEKVAAVQAAIAAERKPTHVPRERPAPVVLDEGPLVLVETRRDLGHAASVH